MVTTGELKSIGVSALCPVYQFRCWIREWNLERAWGDAQYAMGPSAKRRKQNNFGVEEVKFDVSARQEYLSGFRKRKQARIKHAQDVAAKRERQEKIEDRKEVG